MLRDRPASVGEIAAQLPVSRPAVSQHLRLLLGAGLVRYSRVGTRHVYAVDTSGVLAMRTWLDTFLDASPEKPVKLGDSTSGTPAGLAGATPEVKRSKKKGRGKKKRRKER
jgi:hypothetical protein